VTLLADIPVQRKLRYAMLLTSSLALLLAFAVFLAVDFANYRRNLVQGVVTLAKVTADNSTAAVAFSDPVAARGTIEALEADPQIVAAALYAGDGTILARYLGSPDATIPPTPPGPPGLTVRGGSVIVVQPVEESGRMLGLLYVHATEDLMRARMRTTAWVALGGLALSLAFAAVMAVWLGRTLARPIVELDATASAVTAEQDYSRRARQYGRDELGRLTAAFNAMLESAQRSVAALRESEQRFRVLADHAPVLIWMTDPQHRLVWVNQRWLEFAGGTLEEQVRIGWAEGIHPEDRDEAVSRFQAALRERREFQLEYRRRQRDGEYRWIMSKGMPRFDAAGHFLGFISSGIDVSDRRQAEEAMLKARDRALAASRAKDNFLAALSHELRTPLTPVLLLASEEAVNPRHAPAVRADFEMIAKNVALEARLIDDLLDLTRITRGKLALDWSPTDANVVLNDALAAVGAEFEEKKIELRLELAAPRHRLMADPVRLQQVFWNVLKNAAKFTPAGGRVTIGTSVVDRCRLLVRVTDTGIGMTAPELARVFEAFAQGDHAEGGHRFGGLGLGLAITERLVQLHGGSIRATSPGRGLGSTFEIELPLAEVPEGQETPGFARV